MKYIKLQHRVVEARWSESEKGWHVKVENQAEGTVVEDFCHVLLNCNGVLKYGKLRTLALHMWLNFRHSNWKWPEIEGLHDFRGKLLHSARWDSDWDYTGKNVAVIGAGSSGIQIVPKMQKGKSRFS